MTIRRREALVGALLTVFFLLGRGYVFGVRDHAIHLAYIERAADPGFLPGDPMLEVAAQHPSFFFPALALLSRIAPLEAIYFAGYVLSVFAMILGLRSLARRLWGGPAGEWAAAIAVAAAFVHRYVGGDIENLDALFLPRVASLGLLLYALALGARGRFYSAFALTGCVFLIHATTAAHTAFVLWAGCAIGGRTNLRPCLLGPAAFLVAASPLLLLMAIHGGPGIPTPAPEEWIQSLKLHFPFHHFPDLWALVSKVVPAILAVLLGVAVSRWRGAGRLLTGYLVGVIGLFAAAGVGNFLLALPSTIHLHLFEAGRILDCLAILGLGRWIYAAAHAPGTVRLAAVVVAAAYVIRFPLHDWLDYRLVLDFYLLAAAFAVTVFVRHQRLARALPGGGRIHAALCRCARPAPPRRHGSVFAVVFAAVLMVASGRMPRWQPTGAGQPGYKMMCWSREHLPADAVVIIPPYMESPVCALRYFARRRVIGSWKDGGEGTFDLEFQLAWERQVRDLTGVGDRFRVARGPVPWLQYVGWLDEARKSYHQASAEHFLAAAKRNGASHVVREAGAAVLTLPILYRDREFVLYRCSSPSAPAPLSEGGAVREQ